MPGIGMLPMQSPTMQQGLNQQDPTTQITQAALKGLLSGITKTTEQHGMNIAPAMTAQILQQFVQNSGNQGSPLMNPNFGNMPPGGGGPQGPIQNNQGGGNTDNTQMNNQAPATQNIPQDNQQPMEQAQKPSADIWGGLIGLGAGLQGRDVGQALTAYKTSQGKMPIQPGEYLTSDVSKFTAQVKAEMDKNTGLHQQALNVTKQMNDLIASRGLWTKTVGGGTNTKEYKLLKNQLDTINDQIDITNSNIDRMVKNPMWQKAQEASKQSPYQDAIDKAKAAGYSDEEIQAYLKRKK